MSSHGYDIEFKTGDLMSGEHGEIIAHGCNCEGVMGAGVAALVRKKLPGLYGEYKKMCLTDGGEYTFVPGMAWYYWNRSFKSTRIHGVYNLATQVRAGPDANLALIKLAFTNMAQHAHTNGIERVAIPRIGCGIGGLEWMHVEGAIRTGLQAAPSLQRESLYTNGRGGHLTIVVVDLPQAE
jgi:O-acetyl-ADP-ribose deacetylase (regulator of RNase III)